MATIINDKDKLLQATAVRLLGSSNNYIYFNYPAPVFNIDSGGVASPTNYTITAQFAGQLRGAGTVTWSIVSGTIATTGQSGNNWTIASADLTTNTAVIRASLLYLGVTYTADLTVSKLTSGASAVFADLASESDTIAAANDGTGYTLPTGNSLRVYSGAALISSGVTYSGTATKNGLTLTINSTTGVITLSGTSWTTNQESFTLTATYNAIAYTAIYTLTKSRQGSDAVVMDLISDAQVVFAANDGTGYTLPTGNSARLYKGGVVLTTGVTYSGTTTKNGLTLTVNASTGELVLTGASWTTNQENFTITATYNALSYNIVYTIAKSRTGATGATGATGTTGTTGSSARICYSKTTLSSLASTPTTITTTGSSSFPPNNSWGTGTVWQATAPSIVAGESVYQSDGIYNPTTGNTVWNVPYLSNLKVGKLESIVSSTGQLTINSDGHIKGGQTAYDTGTGFFLGYSGSAYKFSIGGPSSSDTLSSLTWDGSNFKLKNAVFQGYSTNTFKIGASPSGNLMSLLASAAPIAVPLVFWNDTSSSSYPFFDVNTNSSDSTTGAAIDFTSSDTAAIALIVTQSGTGGGAAKFFNTPSSKQAWIAPGGYSFYSPSGGGKIYIADGNGPFTGFHDTLSPIDKIIEIGDIMIDTNIICKSGISSTLFETTTSSQANETTVIGIACAIVPVEEGTPGALWKDTMIETDRGVYNHWSMIDDLDPEIISSTYKVVQVNALGEGQINVCGMAGNINAGDYIVTSSIAGKGMRQSDDLVHNYTVAKARESATFDDPTQVKMIACIYLCG
jgi:hypothetical protein